MKLVPVPSAFPTTLTGPCGYAALVLLAVQLAVALDLDDAELGEGVDHRGADAVQAAGHLVGLAAELGPGVEHGHDRFQGGDLGGRVDIHRDAAPVVLDGDGLVRLQGDDDAVAAAGHGLVDGVVGDLIDQVVQAALVGAADVHAGAAPDRLQPAQHLDVLRGVLAGLQVPGVFRRNYINHEKNLLLMEKDSRGRPAEQAGDEGTYAFPWEGRQTAWPVER